MTILAKPDLIRLAIRKASTISYSTSANFGKIQRIKKLQKKLRKIDGLLVSNPINLNYLTQTNIFSEGSRDGFALIAKKSAYLFISCLIAQKNFPDIFDQIFTLKKRNDLFTLLNSLVSNEGFLLGFEENDLKYNEYKRLKDKLKAELVPMKNLVENLRIIKDESEIEKIKKACQITKKAFDYIKNQLKPDRTEKQINWLMEKFFRQNGADDLAFPIIVASGSNSAIPHHQTSNRKLQKNDLVLIDAGCKHQAYCSDITRVFFIGKPKPEWQKIYNIIKTAQQKTIDYLKSSIINHKSWLKACQLDKIAHQYIRTKGYGKYFIHRTGHGLGLAVHEKPHIDQKSQQTLKPAMAFTIEPGIYLPGKFGIRIEDTVVL